MEVVSILAITEMEVTIALVLVDSLCVLKLDVKVAAKIIQLCTLSNFVDINECASNNGGCNQNCHNTPGSYYCSCNSGYNLASNGRACNGKVVASSFVIYACIATKMSFMTLLLHS